VERYNFDSPYWKNRSRADHPRVVQELKVNLKDVATYFHASAQKSKRVEDYQEAARWYRAYLKSFPGDADSAATNYLLAEALFDSHQYQDAATEYEHTAYEYPRNDKSSTAAYAALVCYQKAEETLAGADKQAWHRRATDSGVKFAQTFPEHPDSAGVLTRAAEEIFAAGDRPRAISVSQSILARTPPSSASPGPSSRRPISTRANTRRRSRLTARRARLPVAMRSCAPTSPSASPPRCTAKAKRSRRPATAVVRWRISCA
jgi:tetratricopeptide (TPR) repeat protein